MVVVAEYDLILDQEVIGPAKLNFLFDEMLLSEAEASAPVNPVDGIDARAAVFQFRVPASHAAELRMLVGNDQFLTPTPPIKSSPPTITPAFLNCADADDCSFVASLETANVEFLPPRIIGASKIVPRSIVNGVLLAPNAQNEVDYEPSSSAAKQVAVSVPDRPFETWTLEFDIGDFRSTPLNASLVTAPPLKLTASADQSDCDNVDFDADLPRAVRGEWLDTCRSYNILVRSSVKPSIPVTVTTTAGRLGTGELSAQVDLDETGCGVVPLLLPEPNAAPMQLKLSADAKDGIPNAARTWDFEQTPTSFGELFGPGTVAVLASGTEASEVTGNLIAPGETHLGSRPVALDLRVVNATAPPCNNPLPAENIECDLELVKGAGKGGCQLIHDEVTLDSSGGFTLNLDAEKCFAGQIAIDLWAVKIDEPEPSECLRDVLPLGAEPELLDTITIDYIP